MLKAIDKNQKIWYNNIVIKRRKEVNKMRINLDMDGTIADFYNVKNWLDYLIAEDTTPYEIAKPLLRLCTLARLLNKLQTKDKEQVRNLLKLVRTFIMDLKREKKP